MSFSPCPAVCRLAQSGEEENLRTLLLRHRAGDDAAFTELHSCLAVRLRRFLAARCGPPIEVDDLVQETFLHIHRSIVRYECTRPALPWVFGIARLVLLMELRRRSAGMRSAAEVPLEAVHAVSEDRSLVARSLLAKTIPHVAQDHSQAVLLHHVWGYSFQEVGKLLGVTSGAAKVRSHRGIRRLRDLLMSTTTAAHGMADTVTGQGADQLPA